MTGASAAESRQRSSGEAGTVPGAGRPVARGAGPLRLADLDFDLPKELVAQSPAEPRDASRLLVFERAAGGLRDRRFGELPGLLREGDTLVRNDTRVFPARTFFRRATGGRLEVLFLQPAAPEESLDAAPGELWEALVRGRPRPGETLDHESLGEAWPLVCVEPLGDGLWLVASAGPGPVLGLLERVGVTPLPPYVHESPADPERYQTTYARVVGSAAAPTAGLHFTAGLDDRLRAAGVTIESLTLNVGLGTFRPLTEEVLSENRLHAERYQVDEATWGRLHTARSEGRRIVAVGTTAVRVLEHVARGGPLRGATSLFITPGFEFRMVNALVTNFHLPRTSLLGLVMAFCGVEETRRLYAHAVAERYRFFSFGDAMLAV